MTADVPERAPTRRCLVVYAPGTREVFHPDPGPWPGHADLLAAAADRDIADLAPLCKAGTTAADTAAEDPGVRLLMLDRLYLFVRAAAATASLQFLFVLSDQRRREDHYHPKDTAPLEPLLERWCAARGVGYRRGRDLTQPSRHDHAAETLTATLDEQLAHTPDAAITVALGPGTPATQVGAVLAGLDAMRFDADLQLVQLREVLEERPAKRIVDTAVEPVRHVPQLVHGRTLTAHANDLARRRALRETATVMDSAPDVFTDEQRHLAHAARRYLDRDTTALDDLALQDQPLDSAALALPSAEAADPPATQLWQATRHAAHALDLTEFLWAHSTEAHQQGAAGANDWQAAWYLTLLTVELLPAAWAEHVLYDEWGVETTGPGALNHAAPDEACARELAKFAADSLGVKGEGHQRARALLLGLGAYAWHRHDDHTAYYRPATPLQLPSVDARRRAQWAHFAWYAAFACTRQLRNDLAHRFVTLDRAQLEHELHQANQRFVDLLERCFRVDALPERSADDRTHLERVRQIHNALTGDPNASFNDVKQARPRSSSQARRILETWKKVKNSRFRDHDEIGQCLDVLHTNIKTDSFNPSLFGFARQLERQGRYEKRHNELVSDVDAEHKQLDSRRLTAQRRADQHHALNQLRQRLPNSPLDPSDEGRSSLRRTVQLLAPRAADRGNALTELQRHLTDTFSRRA